MFLLSYINSSFRGYILSITIFTFGSSILTSLIVFILPEWFGLGQIFPAEYMERVRRVTPFSSASCIKLSTLLFEIVKLKPPLSVLRSGRPFYCDHVMTFAILNLLWTIDNCKWLDLTKQIHWWLKLSRSKTECNFPEKSSCINKFCSLEIFEEIPFFKLSPKIHWFLKNSIKLSFKIIKIP